MKKEKNKKKTVKVKSETYPLIRQRVQASKKNKHSTHNKEVRINVGSSILRNPFYQTADLCYLYPSHSSDLYTVVS